MKRYNFDKVPPMASGFAVHAGTIKQAWGKAYALAKKKGYVSKLQFRDNTKCPKRATDDPYVLRGYGCIICHPES